MASYFSSLISHADNLNGHIALDACVNIGSEKCNELSVEQKVEASDIRVSVVGLAAELYICKQISSRTGGSSLGLVSPLTVVLRY